MVFVNSNFVMGSLRVKPFTLFAVPGLEGLRGSFLLSLDLPQRRNGSPGPSSSLKHWLLPQNGG